MGRTIDMTNEFFAMHSAEELTKTPLDYKFTGKMMAQVWSML